MKEPANKAVDITSYFRDRNEKCEEPGANPEPDFRPIRFKANQGDDGTVRFDFDFEKFPDGLDKFLESLMRSAGLEDRPFALTLVNQVVAAIANKTDNYPDKRNAATAALMDIEPGDSLEGMLAAQMVSVHHQAMDSLRMARQSKYLEQITMCQNQAVKLMRLFSTQLEALEKYRRKGRTTITVERRGRRETGYDGKN